MKIQKDSSTKYLFLTACMVLTLFFTLVSLCWAWLSNRNETGYLSGSRFDVVQEDGYNFYTDKFSMETSYVDEENVKHAMGTVTDGDPDKTPVNLLFPGKRTEFRTVIKNVTAQHSYGEPITFSTYLGEIAVSEKIKDEVTLVVYRYNITYADGSTEIKTVNKEYMKFSSELNYAIAENFTLPVNSAVEIFWYIQVNSDVSAAGFLALKAPDGKFVTEEFFRPTEDVVALDEKTYYEKDANGSYVECVPSEGGLSGLYERHNAYYECGDYDFETKEIFYAYLIDDRGRPIDKNGEIISSIDQLVIFEPEGGSFKGYTYDYVNAYADVYFKLGKISVLCV